jgi:FkbM family methyltransferase
VRCFQQLSNDRDGQGLNKDGLEKLLRSSANRFGIDVHRHRPEDSLHGRLAAMLAHHGVATVLDVGANVGQFASALREAGYTGRIVSFEPLADAHALLEKASLDDARWQIAPRAAIGADDGEVEINVSANSFSSSILDLLPAHLDAAPGSVYVSSEVVPMVRLDTVTADLLDAAERPFIKIDTQGYEANVLDGAAALLERAAGLHFELSLVPLYAGQPLYDEMMQRLKAAGFSIWGIWSGIHDPRTGRMLQIDATFFRDSE